MPQKDGSAYFIYKAPHIVGYDDGKPTYWMRAEVTGYVKGKGGFFHGHPMSESRALSTIASNFNKNCGL